MYGISTLKVSAGRSVPRDTKAVDVEEHISGFHVVFF